MRWNPLCNLLRARIIKLGTYGKEDPMVMLVTDSPIPTFRLVDDAGIAVGRIVLPAAERISGVGAETIFLQRDPPFRQRTRRQTSREQTPLTAH